MWSLVSRLAMAVAASFTMTMFLAVIASLAAQPTGYSVSLRVSYWILFPTTFLLSATVLEYLEHGDIARALKVSLLYTGIAAMLIIGLYFAVSPRSRVARNPQRSLHIQLPTTGGSMQPPRALLSLTILSLAGASAHAQAPTRLTLGADPAALAAHN